MEVQKPCRPAELRLPGQLPSYGVVENASAFEAPPLRYNPATHVGEGVLVSLSTPDSASYSVPECSQRDRPC
jgi:hypothetical protein